MHRVQVISYHIPSAVVVICKKLHKELLVISNNSCTPYKPTAVISTWILLSVNLSIAHYFLHHTLSLVQESPARQGSTYVITLCILDHCENLSCNS